MNASTTRQAIFKILRDFVHGDIPAKEAREAIDDAINTAINEAVTDALREVGDAD